MEIIINKHGKSTITQVYALQPWATVAFLFLIT